MAAPIITSITPTHGTTLGGTVVIIAGTDLDGPPPVAVRVAGIPVVPDDITATSIELTMPAHIAGAVDVEVENGDGADTATDGFTYVIAPTISSISPSAGLTRGGNIVAITGTNFRLPGAPPAGYLGGPAPRTVKVTFDGVVAPWAEAASTTLIYATVPIWRGPQSGGIVWPVRQDVRIANLDDAGVELPGEHATLEDGYAISRPELVRECTIQRVVRELLQLLKRHVVDNVAIALGRDYDAQPADWERLRATAPSLRLTGPSTALNRFYSINSVDDELVPGSTTQWRRFQVPVTVDLDFALRGYATTPEVAYTMAQAVVLLFRDAVRLRILRDPTAPADGYIEYEIEVAWDDYPTFNLSPNVSDLYAFDARLLIRGVHIDDDSGTVIRRGWIISSNGGEPELEAADNG